MLSTCGSPVETSNLLRLHLGTSTIMLKVPSVCKMGENVARGDLAWVRKVGEWVGWVEWGTCVLQRQVVPWRDLDAARGRVVVEKVQAVLERWARPARLGHNARHCGVRQPRAQELELCRVLPPLAVALGRDQVEALRAAARRKLQLLEQ